METLFVYTETCTNPKRAREVFSEMRGIGADGVIVCVYEQDLIRWKKDMPRLFEEAGRAGLRRYVSYGRYGGAFSGALMVPSLFTFLRPDSVVIPENPRATAVGETGFASGEFFSKISCVNHPAFRSYMESQTREILTQLQPDGLMFDEPKGLDVVCRCPHCLKARREGESPEQANLRFQVEFVRALADLTKAHRRDFCTMLVVDHSKEEALARFAEVPSLDVLGAEAYWIPRRRNLDWMRQWCPSIVTKLAAFGKRTQLCANNWGMPKSEEPNLIEAYRIMADANPDQLTSFWWWRESDNPERVMELTRQALRELTRKEQKPR